MDPVGKFLGEGVPRPRNASNVALSATDKAPAWV